jgi:hypothetical protein
MDLTPQNPAHADSGSNSRHGLLRLSAPALAVALLALTACLEARAQTQPQTSVPIRPPRTSVFQSDDPRDTGNAGTREEMLRNVEIKRREQAYKENLERAKEGAALGVELLQTYERAKAIGSAEQKKLGRMEKLARAIREQAGGDDDKEELKDLPPDTAAWFVQLKKLSEELNEKVERTPRHVVSTSVINTANRLLGVIRHIRSAFK